MLLRRNEEFAEVEVLNQELFVCMTTELKELNDGVG